MDEDKRFRFLWRVNAVLIAVIAVFVVGSHVSATVSGWFCAPRIASNTVTYSDSVYGERRVTGKWMYGDPVEATGTSGQIVPFYSTYDANEPDRAWQSLRNLLFVNDRLETTWLLPDNKKAISWDLLRRREAADVKAIAVEIVEETGQVDERTGGRLSKPSVFLARPDCTGFTRVLAGLDRRIGYSVVDDDHVVVFYVKGMMGHATKVRLSDFSTVASADLRPVE